MTTQDIIQTPTEQKPIPFGTRLKTARETLGLDRKDAAAQLRLNEKIIIMIEKDRYAADLPVTFIRGYIRAYSKLLQIPDHELKKALDNIKPKNTSIMPIHNLKTAPLTSSNYFMQFFTFLIIFTVFGLAGVWWFSQSNGLMPNVIAADTPASQPENNSIPTTQTTEATETTTTTTTEITNPEATASTTTEASPTVAPTVPSDSVITSEELNQASPPLKTPESPSTYTQSSQKLLSPNSQVDDAEIYNNNAE